MTAKPVSVRGCAHLWHRESLDIVNPNVIVQKAIETFRCARCREVETTTRYHDTASFGRAK